MQDKKNTILHRILFILIPITIFFAPNPDGKAVTIPQSYAEITENTPALIPQKHSSEISTHADQQQFLQDIVDLRTRAKNVPIHVVHYQPISSEPNNSPIKTVNVPSNLRGVALILHSDVPVHWQFGSGNASAKVLFFTGTFPSSIVGSRFEGGPLYLWSFSHKKSCEFGPLCRFTQIDYLQDFKDEASYKAKVELLLQRKVDKFTIIN